MTVLDKSIGALLLGSYVNSMLFVIEAIQGIKYFRGFREDAFLIKAAVGSVLLIDTAATACICAAVYIETVTHWGDKAYLQTESFEIPIYCVTTGLVAWICQLYLCSRAGRMVKSRVARAVVLVVLVALSCTSCAFSIFTGVSVAVYSAYENRAKSLMPVTVWIVLSAVTDIFIATVLIYQLLAVRREYKLRSVENRLGGVLRHLLFIAFSTGAVTSIVALLTLGLFLGDQQSNATIGTGFTLGRIYSLTMLLNLNYRKKLAKLASPEPSSGGRSGGQPKAKRTQLPGSQVSFVGCIQVDREQFVQVSGGAADEGSKCQQTEVNMVASSPFLSVV